MRQSAIPCAVTEGRPFRFVPHVGWIPRECIGGAPRPTGCPTEATRPTADLDAMKARTLRPRERPVTVRWSTCKFLSSPEPRSRWPMYNSLAMCPHRPQVVSALRRVERSRRSPAFQATPASLPRVSASSRVAVRHREERLDTFSAVQENMRVLSDYERFPIC